MLQREGIVDAVLSEDVDTMMFGCSVSLRNWTAEGARGNKTPTHVDVYRSRRTKEISGLDREGMILVALMRGGDYMQAGIPRCGIKIAYQAAKAGFGSDLCRLSKDNYVGLQSWRERLQHELRTNRSGHFQRRYNSLVIPENFPDKKVFGYYTHPKISSPEEVNKFRTNIRWHVGVNISELRSFVAEAFRWTYPAGTKYFIRSLAPALLVNRLVERSATAITDRESLGTKAIAESKLIKTICGRRVHWISDGEPELRIAYVPAEIVGLDPEVEQKGDYESEAMEINDVATDDSDNGARGRLRSLAKRLSTYDPTQVEKMWMLETYVKLGTPLLVETYEEDMRDPKRFATRKARERQALTSCDVQKGAMDRFAKVCKPAQQSVRVKRSTRGEVTYVAPIYPVPASVSGSQRLKKGALEKNSKGLCEKKDTKNLTRTTTEKTRKEPNTTGSDASHNYGPSSHINPWALARRVSASSSPQTASEPSAPALVAANDSISSVAVTRLPVTTVGDAFEPVTPRSRARLKRHARSASMSFYNGASEAEQRLTIPHDPDSHLPAHKSQNLKQPSPRTKRSPQQLNDKSSLPRQLRTLQSTGKPVYLRQSEAVALNDDSFPSPSSLLSPPASQSLRTELTTESDCNVPGVKAKLSSRQVAVRESLEGAWKHVGPLEANAHVTKRVFSSVAVVDLTTV